MSYEPTVWATGDVVTAQKLNKLENGVANSGGGLLVTLEHVDNAFVIDSTYDTILGVIESGGSVIIQITPDTNTIYLHPMAKVPDGPLVFTNVEPIIEGAPAELTGITVTYLEIYSDNSVELTGGTAHFS